jgi:hypothetical protein
LEFDFKSQTCCKTGRESLGFPLRETAWLPEMQSGFLLIQLYKGVDYEKSG